MMGNHTCIVAAGQRIHETLEQITTTTPRDMERLRIQELLMRSFMELDEHSQYAPKGSRENMWCREMIEHLQKAESMEDYLNHATRADVIDKLKYVLRD